MASVGQGGLQQLLALLHAPSTPGNMKFLQAWQQAEGGSAAFNPFNTTEKASGASDYNSVGVKNFRSLMQGLQATAATLENGRYGNILSDLRSGKASPQQLGSDVARSPWGTGSGVLRVLGSGMVPGKGTGASPIAALGGGSPGGASMRDLLLQMVMANNSEIASGKTPGTENLMPVLEMLKSGQFNSSSGGGNAPTQQLQVPHIQNGKMSFMGVSLSGEKPVFLNRLVAAAGSVGATKIKVISGYRSTAHNAAIGGASNSNHTTGNAMDGEAYIPGKGWVPLGQAILPVAGKFGLRSGDVAGFFKGGTDPNHVDDGANLGGLSA